MDFLSFLQTFRIISGMVSEIANDQFVNIAKIIVSNLRAFPSGALLLLFFAVISIGALPWVRSRGFFEVNINNNTIIAIILIGFILSFLTFFLSTSCWAPASSSTAQNSAPTKPQNMFPFQISKFYSCCRACKRRSSPLSWTKKDTSPKSRRRSRKGWFFRQRGKTAIFVLEKGWGQNTFLICGSGLKEKTRSWKLSSWRFSICH